MLVVMAILSILLTVTVTSLGAGQGASLDSGGNMVADVMNLASQNAVAHNAMTAVILAHDSSQDSFDRVFAVYELVEPANGQAPASSDWHQVTKWQTLPAGVIVVDPPTMQSSAAPTVTPATAFPAFTNRGVALSAYQYAIFLPQGNLLGGSSSQLQLATGFYPLGTSTATYTGKKNPSGNPLDYYTISVIAATGRVKIDRP